MPKTPYSAALEDLQQWAESFKGKDPMLNEATERIAEDIRVKFSILPAQYTLRLICEWLVSLNK